MSTATTEHSIVISRHIHAPRQQVWHVLTTPEHIQHFWGPNGFTNTIFEMDVRVGGYWRYTMHAPANADGSPGTDYANWIRYTAITPLERLEYDHGGDDTVNPMFQGCISLQDDGAGTLMTLTVLLASAAQRQQLVASGAVQGGEQNLQRLDAYVSPTPVDQKFIVSRTFKAPRSLVWKAWSDPVSFAQWWGPKGCKIHLAAMDFTEGGVTHYAMQWEGAPDMWGKFVYGRIAPEHSFEFINSFSNPTGEITRAPFPGMEQWPLQVHNTVTLTEHDGQTTVALHGGPINALPAERAKFAGFFDSMNQGFGGTFDQLAEFLAIA
jgi:uncharacterized protein YndB with AHSA1/START domain